VRVRDQDQATRVDWLDRHGARLFWLFLAVHMAVWTLLPSLVNANLPLDVIEGFAWGREPDLGYPKHPPLTRWLGYGFAEASGRSDWAQYLLSQLCVGGAFWALWSLARTLLAPGAALLSVLLLVGVLYHSFSTPEFNPNVILLGIWAFAVLCFRNAADSGSLRWWALLGVAACLGLWSKYFVAVLLLPMALLLLHRRFRGCLATPGPWLAAAIAATGFAPHLLWMLETGFVTVTYALERASDGRPSLTDHLVYPLRFLVEQAAALLPLLLLLLALGRPALRPPGDAGQAAWRWPLLVLAVGPLLLLVLLSASTGWRLRTMWAAPLFPLSGLVALLWLQPVLTRSGLRRFAVLFALLFALGPLAYAGIYLLGPAVTDSAKRTHFAGAALSSRIAEEWQRRFGSTPPVIIADHWLGGNLVYYAAAGSPLAEAPLYVDSDSRLTPWVDDAVVRRRGAVAVWRYAMEGDSQVDRLPRLLTDCKERFGECRYQEPIALDWHTLFPTPRILIGWAIIPPARGEARGED